MLPENMYDLSPVDSLEDQKRMALSRLLREAREAKRWTQEKASEMATEALRAAALDASFEASAEERALWGTIEITFHHVSKMETYPAFPLMALDRRSRLLGLTLALGLDRARVNRLCGGL